MLFILQEEIKKIINIFFFNTLCDNFIYSPVGTLGSSNQILCPVLQMIARQLLKTLNFIKPFHIFLGRVLKYNIRYLQLLILLWEQGTNVFNPLFFFFERKNSCLSLCIKQFILMRSDHNMFQCRCILSPRGKFLTSYSYGTLLYIFLRIG